MTDPAHVQAMQNMLSTKEGKAFIGRYMKADQKLRIGNKIYTFKSNGDRAKDNLHLVSTSEEYMGRANGMTRAFTKDFSKQVSEGGINDNIKEGIAEVIDLKKRIKCKKSDYDFRS